MNFPARVISGFFLPAFLFALNGCMTNSAVKHAQGISSHEYYSGPGEVTQYEMHTQPRPAYYGLLPLTIPADIITSPIQLGYYLLHKPGQEPVNAQDSE